MTAVLRETIWYAVGNERSPTDPFGRTSLRIEPDGRARLGQTTRAGGSSWTGRIDGGALDQFYAALELARFPDMPSPNFPAGSAIRDLALGRPPALRSAYIAWHASESLPGYDVAFRILDLIVRQLSEDTVKAGPAGAPIVSGVTRAPRPANGDTPPTFDELLSRSDDQIPFSALDLDLLDRLALQRKEPIIATLALAELRRKDQAKAASAANAILAGISWDDYVSAYAFALSFADDRDIGTTHMQVHLRSAPYLGPIVLGVMGANVLADPARFKTEGRGREVLSALAEKLWDTDVAKLRDPALAERVIAMTRPPSTKDDGPAQARLVRALEDNALREALSGDDPVRHFLLRAGAYFRPLHAVVDFTDWNGAIVGSGAGELLRAAIPPSADLSFSDLAPLLTMGTFARELVARHPSTPETVLVRLASDSSFDVQEGVLERTDRSEREEERLAMSRSIVIRKAAAAAIWKRSPHLS